MSLSKYTSEDVLKALHLIVTYITGTFQTSRNPHSGRGITHKGRNAPKRVTSSQRRKMKREAKS